MKTLLFCFFCFFSSCERKTEISNGDDLKLNLIDSYIKNSKDHSKTIEERKEYLSKVNDLIYALPNNTFKIKKLHNISIAYYKLLDWENYKLVSIHALKLSEKISDSSKIARSLGNLGVYYRRNEIDSAYKKFYESEKIYSSFDKNKNRFPSTYAFNHGKILIDLAKLSRKVKDYSNSESITIKAIQKFELSQNLEYIPLSYSLLGTIAKELEHYEDAIMYHQKAMEYAKDTPKDTLYLMLMHNNIGTVLKSKQKYKESEHQYHKGLSLKHFLSNRPKRHARLLDNLGYVKFLANKNNDSVLYLFNRAYKIRDSINDIVGLSTSYLHLAEYHQSKENNNLSKEFAEKAKEAATTINENTELLQAYDLLAQVSPPEEGRTYAMEYIKLSDSLNKRDNLFRDKFARIRYESENLEKENEQKNKEIIDVQNQNTIYFLGIILLITFIGFLIYFSRQRNRYLAQQNKIVEFQAAYETETRISKRLHDELGNDIFQVMMQYQHDPHDPQITKKLNTAYTKARDISRENSEFEVDETYLEELTDMLTNYTKNNIKLILRGVEKISWDMVDKNLKITIYRVLQELMTNMQKHSQADLVAVVFKNEKNNMIIKYSDNGVGIQKEDLKSKNGLRNTEKRILAINGTIIFDSEKNKGFKAEIKIPS